MIMTLSSQPQHVTSQVNTYFKSEREIISSLWLKEKKAQKSDDRRMHELMSVLVQERFGFEIQFSKLL
jgi:hypothetical protein